jgi:plasmid replication initiation protein
MYELLVQFLTVGKREFEIKNLRGILGLEKEYSELDNFKKFVLDVSVKQINQFTDINTSYSQRRTGRKVSHFLFAIAAKTDAPKKKKAAPMPTAPRATPQATPRPKQTPEEKAHGTAKLAEMVAMLKLKRPNPV